MHQLGYGGGEASIFGGLWYFFGVLLKMEKKVSYKHSGASSPPPTPGRQTPSEWQGKASPLGGVGGLKQGCYGYKRGSMCSQVAESDEKALRGLFYQGTNPIVGAPPSWPMLSFSP